MRYIVYIAIISLSVIVFSLYPDKGTSRQPRLNLHSKATPEYVILSVDSVSPASKEKISLYYHDSLAFGHPIMITKNNTRVKLSAPAFFFIPNLEQSPYLIYPGEKIKIKKDEYGAIEMVIEGNPQRTDELNFFANLVRKTGNIHGIVFMPYHKKAATLKEIKNLETKINDVKNNRLEFLASYLKQKSVSKEFEKTTINIIQSKALTDTLLLYFSNRSLLEKQNLYKKLLSEKIMTIRSIAMTPLQVYYTTCNMLVSLSLRNPPYYVIQTNTELSKRLDFIQGNFISTTRDFLMANAVSSVAITSTPVTAANTEKFNRLCKDSGYRQLVKQKLTAIKTSAPPNGNNNFLSANGKTVVSMQSVLAKQKGKIILLDFWASWCGSCREEIPYMESLEKQYKNKNIMFLRISTDQKIEDWIRAMEEESLVTVNDFLLLNADQSSFVKRYDINTIPRFLLIGKDGRVIHENTPRPSDPKLKTLIDKNL